MQPYLQLNTEIRLHKILLATVYDIPVQEHLVLEDDQAQVIHVLTVVLLDIDIVHVQEDVPDHQHGGLMVIPSCI